MKKKKKGKSRKRKRGRTRAARKEQEGGEKKMPRVRGRHHGCQEVILLFALIGFSWVSTAVFCLVLDIAGLGNGVFDQKDVKFSWDFLRVILLALVFEKILRYIL